MPTDSELHSLDTDARLSKCLSTRPVRAYHAAKRLGLSPRMVRHLAETGKLRGFKKGKKIWHFFPYDVEAFRAWRENLHV